MGIILFIVALLLAIPLSVPALIHLIIGAFRWKGKFKYIDDAFMRGAEAIDVFGAMMFSTFFNDWFIKKGGYHYGQGRETISSAAGKNWVNGTASFLGLGFVGFLDLMDEDHCWKYIEGRTSDMVKPNSVKPFYTLCFTLLAIASLYSLWKLVIWIV